MLVLISEIRPIQGNMSNREVPVVRKSVVKVKINKRRVGGRAMVAANKRPCWQCPAAAAENFSRPIAKRRVDAILSRLLAHMKAAGVVLFTFLLISLVLAGGRGGGGCDHR